MYIYIYINICIYMYVGAELVKTIRLMFGFVLQRSSKHTVLDTCEKRKIRGYPAHLGTPSRISAPLRWHPVEPKKDTKNTSNNVCARYVFMEVVCSVATQMGLWISIIKATFRAAVRFGTKEQLRNIMSLPPAVPYHLPLFSDGAEF